MILDKTTYNNQHEVFKNSFELRVSGDGDGDIANRPQKCPDEPRHSGCPPCQDLHAQRYGVNIRAIVCHNRERENDQAELPEFSQGWE